MKLNLGCGDKILDGYINIDLVNPNADKLHDCTDLSFIEDNQADEILAVAILEHIHPLKVMESLKEWFRVLKPSGRLIIEVPDMLEICRMYENADRGMKYFITHCLFGAWMPEYPHLYGWCEELLFEHFIGAGFKNIIRAEPQGGHWGPTLRMEGTK
jgi:predicted SAM-dependent methyltransferase